MARYDVDPDFYVGAVRAVMRFTREEQARIGEFINLEGDANDPAFGDQIVERLRLRRNPRPHDLLHWVKLLWQARNLFDILASHGHPTQSCADVLDETLQMVAALNRRGLVRGLLFRNRIDGADQGLQFLKSEIEAGQWPTWREEIEEEVRGVQSRAVGLVDMLSQAPPLAPDG